MKTYQIYSSKNNALLATVADCCSINAASAYLRANPDLASCCVGSDDSTTKVMYGWTTKGYIVPVGKML
jgi:hypothetical protein